MFHRKKRWTSIRRSVTLVAVAGIVCACGDTGADRSPPDIEALPLPALAGSAQPHLATGSTGELVLSWQEPAGDATALRFSSFDGEAWGEANTVATGSRWFVNWADFPSVIPVAGDFWAAHWLAKRDGGTYAYDVAVAISTDSGASWSQAITPHRDGTATEHGFVTLFPVDGKAGALWLDGRNTSPDTGHDHGGGAMTLRSAMIGPDQGVTDAALIDDSVCDCCQTDVAISGTTPVAVYRNRDESEIRDIYVARLESSGWTKGTPIADDRWKIAGCPVNGPAIAAHGEQLAVAWFTAADDEPRVRFAASRKNGAFGTPIDVASGNTLGRVDVVLLDDGSAVVSHLRNIGNGKADVVLTRIAADGSPGNSLTAATTASGRMTGFPQLARYGNDLVIAWTGIDASGATLVRSARLATPPQ
jgi:hypothetical protein